MSGDVRMRESDFWRRCDVCGQFIALDEFQCGRASRRLVTPDSDRSGETYETLCHQHSAALTTEDQA